jgi:hypothetical protein
MINRIQKEAACVKRKQQIEKKDKGYCFKVSSKVAVVTAAEKVSIAAVKNHS